MTKDFSQALRERRERAAEVAETYQIVYAGSQCWVVRYPAESEEQERCYLVDMVNHSCSCPDWWGYCKDKELDCKHIQAVAPEWEQLTGLKFTYRSVYVPEAVEAARKLMRIDAPDEDDPFGKY